MPNALLFLANGFEDIEAITVSDILRRADISVTLAGVGSTTITGARGIVVTTDTTVDMVTNLYDACICPGGMPGAQNLVDTPAVKALLNKHAIHQKIIAAICAAPAIVLAPLGLLEGKKATCYPDMENRFNDTTTHIKDPVVVDGTLITSRGPATALPFALALVESLVGREKALAIAQDVLMPEVYK